jgi:hypothetical protein
MSDATPDQITAFIERWEHSGAAERANYTSGGLRPSRDLSGGGETVPHLSGSDGHRPPLQSFEQQLLTRLVALNHERAAEEKRGLIRWLRPDYQAPGASSDGHRPPLQTEITLTDDEEPIPTIAAALAWPETMAEQVVAVRKLLTSVGPDSERLAACFGRKSHKRSAQITAILDTLKALGHIN